MYYLDENNKTVTCNQAIWYRSFAYMLLFFYRFCVLKPPPPPTTVKTHYRRPQQLIQLKINYIHPNYKLITNVNWNDATQRTMVHLVVWVDLNYELLEMLLYAIFGILNLLVLLGIEMLINLMLLLFLRIQKSLEAFGHSTVYHC